MGEAMAIVDVRQCVHIAGTMPCKVLFHPKGAAFAYRSRYAADDIR